MDEWGHGYSPYFHIFYIFVHLLSSFLLMNYVGVKNKKLDTVTQIKPYLY